MEAIDRITLFNLEAEESVLGSIFFEPELIKDCNLKAEEFSPGANYKTFATFLDLDKKGLTIDPLSVANRLGAAIEQVGGVSRLLELASSVPSTRNFKRHCEIVREHYQRRRIIDIAEKLKISGLEGDLGETLTDIQKDLQNVLESGSDKFEGDISEELSKLVEKVQNADGKITGIYPGFRDLAKVILSYKKGQLIVTGARPSMGRYCSTN